MRTDVLPSFDGTKLAVHRMGPEGGGGRPVLLLHGLFSDANTNWIKFGHAAKLAAAGFEAIMPDLRAHGQSDKPHDPAAYPDDILARDAAALVAALGLEDFDLAGFSLGARTSARAVINGLRPRKLVLAGMGLEGLAGWNRRSSFFLDAIDRFDEVKRGDPAFMAVSFMKTMKIDPVAARLLLMAGNRVDMDALLSVDTPIGVICGADDHDNGSAPELAEALPNARYYEIPGTHMSCITRLELGQSIVDFLTA